MTFRSFWQAGFESACHINRQGTRLDMVTATQHDRFLDEDYARVRSLGIRVVREGVRWPVVASGGRFNLDPVRQVADAARRHDLQVIWTLLHYGTPEGIDLFSPILAGRFADYAAAVARVIGQDAEEPTWFAPVNEISFLAWAAGAVGYMYPFATGRGGELKRNLVRAALAGMDAIRGVNPEARFVHCDPLINVVAPPGRPDLARAAADETEAQFEAWDMLAGGLHPELGGHPRYLDVLGINYYHANQWEIGGDKLPWDEGAPDPRRVPFHELLARVYRRYQLPLLVSETSHVGSGRARWIRDIAQSVEGAGAAGIPVEGICLYPVIDRPDWDDPDHWHHSGVWDLVNGDGPDLRRHPCDEYLLEIQGLVRSGDLKNVKGKR